MTAQTPGAASGSGAQGPPAKEQAKQAAGTAAEESKHVAGVAGEEAKNVAEEAKYQARNLMGDLQTQVSEQSKTQMDRLRNLLQEFSDELESMASSGGRAGLATDVVRQVSDKARSLGDKMEGREPGDVLEDVRRMARRKPGTFLLGAAALGVVAGRLTRGGTKDTSGGGGGQVERLGTARVPATTTTPVTSPGTTPPPTTSTGYGTTPPRTPTITPPGAVDPVEPGLQPDPYRQRRGMP